jgi:hypothetical protein
MATQSYMLFLHEGGGRFIIQQKYKWQLRNLDIKHNDTLLNQLVPESSNYVLSFQSSNGASKVPLPHL